MDTHVLIQKGNQDNSPHSMEQKEKLGIFQNMRQAAAATGIPWATIKAIKANPKCTAFTDGGRVDADALMSFIQENPEAIEVGEDDTLQKWKVLLTKSNALIAEKELEELQGKYILREEAEQQIRAIALSQKAMLRSRLVNELPQKLVGMTVPQMVVVMENTLNQICGLMNELKVNE